MPLREKNGLIHLMEGHAGKDHYGITRCGMLYRRKRKDTTWKPTIRFGLPTVWRMRPSSRKPTCVACVAGVRAPIQ